MIKSTSHNPLRNTPHPSVLVRGVGQRREARPRLVQCTDPVLVSQGRGLRHVYVAYFSSVQFSLIRKPHSVFMKVPPTHAATGPARRSRPRSRGTLMFVLGTCGTLTYCTPYVFAPGPALRHASHGEPADRGPARSSLPARRCELWHSTEGLLRPPLERARLAIYTAPLSISLRSRAARPTTDPAAP